LSDQQGPKDHREIRAQPGVVEYKGFRGLPDPRAIREKSEKED
jgi:hypothetical protein